jgi:hypothetical protein
MDGCATTQASEDDALGQMLHGTDAVMTVGQS